MSTLLIIILVWTIAALLLGVLLGKFIQRGME
jgi:uncharacterized protein YneF (UPF0154 family)